MLAIPLILRFTRMTAFARITALLNARWREKRERGATCAAACKEAQEVFGIFAVKVGGY
jgi:hypothetical protein